MLYFWNNGAPQRAKITGSGNKQRLTIPGDPNPRMGRIVADPDIDLYNYVEAGPRPNKYQGAGPLSYDNDGWTITATRTVQDRGLDQVKAARVAEVQAKRSDVAHAGIVFSTLPLATDATTIDSINLIASALADGETLPANFKWETMDGRVMSPTGAQFKLFRNAVAKHFMSCTKAARIHKEAIEAAVDVAAVLAVDIETGWPANPVLED